MRDSRRSAVDLLHSKLKDAMRELGYETILPVQEKSIPVIMAGYNTIIVAPTGSGKTEAAVFPVASRMIECRERGSCREGVLLVYITPLRALNRDIESRISNIFSKTGFGVMVRHGDTTPKGRRKFLSEFPDVMITTPESLNLLLTVESLRRAWSNVRWVIVDELHEFVDNERGSELAVILERLERFSRHRIQRIGLSATLSKRTLREQAARLLAGRRHVEIVEDPSPKRYEITVETVEEGIDFWITASRRIAEIVQSAPGNVLVFVNTRGTAERLAAVLARNNVPVAVHHGSLSRGVREKAERDFKEGKIKALVATSSMELGVDIGSVSLVIQFLSPRSVITMAQRAGRAGHRYGETSRAIIVTTSNIFETLESTVIAFRAAHGYLEDLRAHMNPLDALAHQLAGILLEEKTATSDWLYSFVRRAYPFENLSPEDYEDVLEHLDAVRVIRWDPENRTARRGSRIYRYFYRVSMIPDERNYTVFDVLSGEKVGELSERFVEAQLMRSRTGRFAFVLAGRIWEALDADLERGRIEARQPAEVEGYYPSWEGELIPVDYKIAREVCSIISLCMTDAEACRRLLTARGLREEQIDRIISVLQSTKELWGAPLLSPSTPVVEPIKGGAVVYSCLGSKGNFALALLLSRLLKQMTVEVVFDYIPYAIILRNPMGIRPSLVAGALREAAKLSAIERRFLVEDAVKDSLAFVFRFLQVAKRMVLLTRIRAYLENSQRRY
jgi:ATP-dependent Lhr-like helicase